MRIVLLGASGMLGQALMGEGQARGHTMIGDRVDVRDREALKQHLHVNCPDLIINAAALTDLTACEANPCLAFRINTYPLIWIDQYRKETLRPPKLVQISTDQAYDCRNQYAKSKLTAELLVGLDDLVVRTNIVGFRGHGKPTFAEWAMEAIEQDAAITLFYDYYTSSIDVWSFSSALFYVLEEYPDWRFIRNIASRDISSKKEFIEALAFAMGRTLTRATLGSVKNIQPQRPLNSGLDVHEIGRLLRRRMPSLEEVVNTLVERRKLLCTNPLPSTAG